MARRAVLAAQRGGKDIRAGRRTYVISEGSAGGAQLALVTVVRGEFGSYLRTTADTTAVNNLDRLPGCTQLPRRCTRARAATSAH